MNETAIPPTLSPQPKTSGLAISSLVLGCLAFFMGCLTGIPAIIFGHVALSKIKKSQGQLIGNGFAIAGLVLGYFLTFFGTIILAGLAVPTAMKALNKAEEITLHNNVMQVKAALDLYAGDFHGSYPSSLSELVSNGNLIQTSLDEFITVKAKSGVPEQLIYVPNLTQMSRGDLIVLYSPLLKTGNRLVIRVDSSAEMLTDVEAKSELASQGVIVP